MSVRRDRYHEGRERLIALLAGLMAVALFLAIAPFDADDAPGRIVRAADTGTLWLLLGVSLAGLIYAARR